METRDFDPIAVTDQAAKDASETARIIGSFYRALKEHDASDETARQLTILYARRLLNGRTLQ